MEFPTLHYLVNRLQCTLHLKRGKRVVDRIQGFRQNGESRQLIIFLHAWTRTEKDMWPLGRLAQRNRPDADFWMPRLPIRWWFSQKSAEGITVWLIGVIDRLVEQRRLAADRGGSSGSGYEEVLFVGHSYGAVLARAVWARAAGGQPNGIADFRHARPWVTLVSRMVLLAAVARGWNQNARVSYAARLLNWAAVLLDMLPGTRWAIFDLRRGSTFLTTMRLQTLSAMRLWPRAWPPQPLTVQLLGTLDDVVAPADNVDLATGGHFLYLTVPDAGHLSIVLVDERKHCDVRQRLFQLAISGTETSIRSDRAVLSEEAVADMTSEAADDLDLEFLDAGPQGDAVMISRVREKVNVVIFVTHGIRDYGFWTQKLAVHLKERARNLMKEQPDRNPPLFCRTITSTYGYFPMLPFLFRVARRHYVGWLMDQYVTARASYPNAQVCFVGHSNGTYLAARALQDCQAVHFERVVFAGSVVRPDYDWLSVLSTLAPTVAHSQTGLRPQVGRALNYVATGDWVVALAPRALMTIAISDLGDAGFSGFPAHDGLCQIEWVPGAHSAALAVRHWDEIADFLLLKQDPQREVASDKQVRNPRQRRRANRRSPGVVALGWASPFLVPLLALLGFTLGYMALLHLRAFTLEQLSAFCQGAAVFTGTWLLIKLLMKL